jgi:transcriptional regulator with XRE-family HTH domain
MNGQIGINIAELRKSRGVKQEGIAKAVGVSDAPMRTYKYR